MKKNIGVFFGGRSVEHEISIISAMQVIKAIDTSKYEVTAVYISQEGIWYVGNWLNYLDNFKNMKSLIEHCKKVIPCPYPGEGTLLSYPEGFLKSSKVLAKIDIAFPVFHGTYGEDGCMQGVFELMNIPYASSDVVSSAICMNKSFTKEICMALQIPVIPYYRLDIDAWYQDKKAHLSAIERAFSYPLIVKPNDLGSSIGVGKAGNAQELENAIELAGAYSSDILVEKCVTAIKEVNCSVAETIAGTQVSECEEPLSGDEVLTFEEKYLSTEGASAGMASTKRKIPAGIPEQQKQEIQGYARRIFQHLGCSGIVRIDFIVDTTENKAYLNEINTIPGSLAFYLWEATGKKFPAIISEVISSAEKRHLRANKNKRNFKSSVLFKMDGSKLSGKLG